MAAEGASAHDMRVSGEQKAFIGTSEALLSVETLSRAAMAGLEANSIKAVDLRMGTFL